MQKYPQGVDAVLVTGDDMALCGLSGASGDNNSAAYQKTVICGFDGNQAAVEALDRGELTVDTPSRAMTWATRPSRPLWTHSRANPSNR
ncbi:MAG: hypothetical protein ACLSF2_00580 [Butyricicoccus sp.]